MNENVKETELVMRTANGDRKAFTVLYSRHLHPLYRYIYLFTKSKDKTEEIIQNVFVKIWERRENLLHITFFKAYLYRSAKNILLDEIRKSQLEAKAAFLLKPDTEESTEYADTKLIYNQYCEIAQEAINLLPEKRKRIVELRTQDELTLDEIAARLSISKCVVKKQLYAGKSFIREYMEKHAEFTVVFLLFHFFFN